MHILYTCLTIALLTADDGSYIRQRREPSLTDASVFILLCEYLTIYENATSRLNTVLYMDGDSCINTVAMPILMETMTVVPTSIQVINQTVPLSDDTRSDFLGAYDLNATDDTSSR